MCYLRDLLTSAHLPLDFWPILALLSMLCVFEKSGSSITFRQVNYTQREIEHTAFVNSFNDTR